MGPHFSLCMDTQHTHTHPSNKYYLKGNTYALCHSIPLRKGSLSVGFLYRIFLCWEKWKSTLLFIRDCLHSRHWVGRPKGWRPFGQRQKESGSLITRNELLTGPTEDTNPNSNSDPINSLLVSLWWGEGGMGASISVVAVLCQVQL